MTALERSTSSADLATAIRLSVLDMTHRSGASHVGTGYSIADILAVLYSGVLEIAPENPTAQDRDRLILSKGHGCAALYAALAHRGFFPLDWLDTFYLDGGRLFGHITHKGVPGVEASTGALGHGLPIAAGQALWLTDRTPTARVFAVLSDGECDEGSTWEAALFAGAHHLQNLTVIIDYNRIQSLGTTDDILNLEPLADKWRAFGWDVQEVDGHDHDALRKSLERDATADRPRCIVAHTVKGRGVSFMEHSVLWHYRAADADEYRAARAELEGHER